MWVCVQRSACALNTFIEHRIDVCLQNIFLCSSGYGTHVTPYPPAKSHIISFIIENIFVLSIFKTQTTNISTGVHTFILFQAFYNCVCMLLQMFYLFKNVKLSFKLKCKESERYSKKKKEKCSFCMNNFQLPDSQSSTWFWFPQLLEFFSFLGEMFIFCYIGFVLLTFPRHVFSAFFICGAFVSFLWEAHWSVLTTHWVTYRSDTYSSMDLSSLFCDAGLSCAALCRVCFCLRVSFFFHPLLIRSALSSSIISSLSLYFIYCVVSHLLYLVSNSVLIYPISSFKRHFVHELLSLIAIRGIISNVWGQIQYRTACHIAQISPVP